MRSRIANHFELWKIPLHGSILWIKGKQKFLHNTGMHHLYIGLVYNAPQRSTFEVHSKSVPTRACRHVQGCVLHTSSNFEQQLLRNPDVQGQLDLASNVLSRTAIADARLQAHRITSL